MAQENTDPAHLADPARILKTRDTYAFRRSLRSGEYDATVFIRSDEEKERLRDCFRRVKGQLKEPVSTIHVHFDDVNQPHFVPNDDISLEDIEPAREELEEMLRICRFSMELPDRVKRQDPDLNAVPDFTITFRKEGPDFDTELHPHPSSILNTVFYDSATGWVTPDGPDEAGEGNLFYFKPGFYHRATTKSETDVPKERLAVIITPTSGYWPGYE